MPRVRFLEERIVQDEHRHDPVKRTMFSAGEVYELSDASYRHWLSRVPIEVVMDEGKPVAAAAQTLPPVTGAVPTPPVSPTAPDPFPPLSEPPVTPPPTVVMRDLYEDKPPEPDKSAPKGTSKGKG